MKKRIFSLVILSLLGIFSLFCVFALFFLAISGYKFMPLPFMIFMTATLLAVKVIVDEVFVIRTLSDIKKYGSLAYGVVIENPNERKNNNVVAFVSAKKRVVTIGEMFSEDLKEYDEPGLILKLRAYGNNFKVEAEVQKEQLPETVRILLAEHL